MTGQSASLGTIWHPYAGWQARQTLVYATAMTLAVVVLIVLTDEVGSRIGARLARLAAISPAIASASIATVLGQARARGEMRALATLGCGPIAAGSGAILAGWGFCSLALALLSTPWVSLGSLFPSVASATTWVLMPDGSWSAPVQKVNVAATGELKLGALAQLATRPAADLSAATWAAFGPVALGLPLWTARPMATWLRGLTGSAAVALLLVGLHGVASGSLAGPWLAVASAPIWIGLALACGD